MHIYFFILKLYLYFSNEYQFCKHFVSHAFFSFVEQFIVLLLEGFSKEKCAYYAISFIKTVLIIHKGNATSVKAKLNGACY